MWVKIYFSSNSQMKILNGKIIWNNHKKYSTLACIILYIENEFDDSKDVMKLLIDLLKHAMCCNLMLLLISKQSNFMQHVKDIHGIQNCFDYSVRN